MIQDLSGSWCIKATDEFMTRVDSLIPLMHHDPDRSWITDPDPDLPKRMQPNATTLYTHELALKEKACSLLSGQQCRPLLDYLPLG